MKIEHLNKKEEAFEPIELKLTIESKEELAELWARLNAPVRGLMDLNMFEDISDNVDPIGHPNLYDFFDLVDDIAEEMGVLK